MLYNEQKLLFKLDDGYILKTKRKAYVNKSITDREKTVIEDFVLFLETGESNEDTWLN